MCCDSHKFGDSSENITAMEKMGIMELSDGVHTVVVMAMEKIEFFVLSIAIVVAV